MQKIEMLSILLFPSRKLSHIKNLENAVQWLNLNTFDYFDVCVYFKDGSISQKQLKNTEEFDKWTKSMER